MSITNNISTTMKRGRGRPPKNLTIIEPRLAENTEPRLAETPIAEIPNRKLITIDKLTNEAQYDIIYSYYYGKKIKEIAAQYDISTTTIYNISRPNIAAGHYKRTEIERITKEAKIKSLEDKRDAMILEYNNKIELLKAD